jgi:hypothetical protein
MLVICQLSTFLVYWERYNQRILDYYVCAWSPNLLVVKLQTFSLLITLLRTHLPQGFF